VLALNPLIEDGQAIQPKAAKLVIGFEKVADVWQELERLARQEQIEIEEQREFRPDWKSMVTLNGAGIFQVLTARVDGRMVGYFSWLLDFDMESKGTLIVNQTAWFVEKNHPIVAVRMFDKAIAEFKRIGVEYAYLHHTIKGRGAALGRLFERRGAKLLGYNYIMPIKTPLAINQTD
jgi:hypothetical protein